MAVPWRAAEAMHWQIGESEMARRAGVTPFSLSSTSTDTTAMTSSRRDSPSRIHSHSHNQALTSEPRVVQQKLSSNARTLASCNTKLRSSSPSNLGCQKSAISSSGTSLHTVIGGESTPRSVPPASQSDGVALAAINGSSRGVGQQLLPGVAEMTTGVSPYISPAYATSRETRYPSPGPKLPGIGPVRVGQNNSYYQEWPGIKEQHDSAAGYHEIKRQ